MSIHQLTQQIPKIQESRLQTQQEINKNKLKQLEKPKNPENKKRLNSFDRALEFSKVLQDVQSNKDIKISAHAIDRLKERNINLTTLDMSNIRSAVEKLREKGGKEALILYGDTAFIASVKNNTIITAVDKNNIKDNVFTNIDSAVII